jgi:hypothetical protein
MFTTKSLDKALGEVRGFHNKSIFSAKKSLVAYRLSRMSRNYRGGVVERMVRDYYKKSGKNVAYFGGSVSFDMMVNGKRIEVKSALARPCANGYSYNFQHICPANFHKLVLVFISPEGVTSRIMDSRTVAKYLGSKNKHKGLYVKKKIFGKLLAA